MRQAGHCARLAQETGAGLASWHTFRQQELDRHVPIKNLIVGTVDDAHTAFPDALGKPVAALQLEGGSLALAGSPGIWICTHSASLPRDFDLEHKALSRHGLDVDLPTQ